MVLLVGLQSRSNLIIVTSIVFDWSSFQLIVIVVPKTDRQKHRLLRPGQRLQREGQAPLSPQ